MTSPTAVQSSSDIQAIAELTQLQFPLAEAFYRSHKYKIRLGRQERIFILRLSASGEIIAAVRLLLVGEQSYWLRNLLVAKPYRGQGLGRELMLQLLATISPNPCFCFALPDVQEFYAALGFVRPALDVCPVDIQQQYLKYKSRARDWVLMAAAL